jgi:outer membrane protein TolC
MVRQSFSAIPLRCELKNVDSVKMLDDKCELSLLPCGAAEPCAAGGSSGLRAQTIQIPASERRQTGQRRRASRAACLRARQRARASGYRLDEAIQRGLKTNLGVILSGTETAAARGQRLSELQALLPEVDFKAQESLMQVDLPAEGLRIPGFPKILGPFGFTDVRASLSWSLVDVASLRNYMAAKHNFAAAQLSAQDARDLVVLTVGNAYLLAVADETEVSSVEAQVATAKVSLDQAVANHNAGRRRMLDELRAKVDYQSLEQQLIVAQNSLEKDKLALARTIGLPLAKSCLRWPTRLPTRPSIRLMWMRRFARLMPTARILPRCWSRPRRPSSNARRPRRTGCRRLRSTAITAILA